MKIRAVRDVFILLNYLSSTDWPAFQEPILLSNPSPRVILRQQHISLRSDPAINLKIYSAVTTVTTESLAGHVLISVHVGER